MFIPRGRTRMLNIYCMLFGFVCLCCMDCVNRIHRKGVSTGKDTHTSKAACNYTTTHAVCVRYRALKYTLRGILTQKAHTVSQLVLHSCTSKKTTTAIKVDIHYRNYIKLLP